MTISIKQKALLYTTVVFVGGLAASLALSAIIDMLTRETVLYIAGGVFLVWFFWLTYEILVSHFEHKESLKKFIK